MGVLWALSEKERKKKHWPWSILVIGYYEKVEYRDVEDLEDEEKVNRRKASFWLEIPIQQLSIAHWQSQPSGRRM